jgi:hypothetical protein
MLKGFLTWFTPRIFNVVYSPESRMKLAAGVDDAGDDVEAGRNGEKKL